MSTDRNKPVDTNEFWKERINNARRDGDIRRSVFTTPEPEWQKICYDHRKILEAVCAQNKIQSVLDAGCGYGRGIDLMPYGFQGRYVGVDQSEDFIEIAKSRYPDGEYYCENLKNLPFDDNEFDISICTSVMIMIVQNMGWFEWEKIQNELLRVSKQGILCLEYGKTDTQTESTTYYFISDTNIQGN